LIELKVIQGPETGRTIRADGEQSLIVSGALTGSKPKPRQRRRRGGWLVRPLAGGLKVLINGKPADGRQAVMVGDRLSVGDVVMQVTALGDADEADSANGGDGQDSAKPMFVLRFDDDAVVPIREVQKRHDAEDEGEFEQSVLELGLGPKVPLKKFAEAFRPIPSVRLPLPRGRTHDPRPTRRRRSWAAPTKVNRQRAWTAAAFVGFTASAALVWAITRVDSIQGRSPEPEPLFVDSAAGEPATENQLSRMVFPSANEPGMLASQQINHAPLSEGHLPSRREQDRQSMADELWQSTLTSSVKPRSTDTSTSLETSRFVAEPADPFARLDQSEAIPVHAEVIDKPVAIQPTHTVAAPLTSEAKPVTPVAVKETASPQGAPVTLAQADQPGVVFLLDASGSMVDRLPEAVDYLRQRIEAMDKSERFAVVMFSGQGPTLIPAEGYGPATDLAKQQALEFLNVRALHMTPEGQGDRSFAIMMAITLAAPGDELVLITDPMDSKSGQALYDAVTDIMAGADLRLSTVQLVDQKIDFMLKRLAKDFGGTHLSLVIEKTADPATFHGLF